MSAAELSFHSRFQAYSDEISRRLCALAAGLADPLGALARPLVESYSPTTWTHPYSFPLAHLPLWLLDCAGRLSPEGLLESAVDCGYAANCGYLYIRLQDDVYDEPDSPADARLLLVGNELIRECFCAFSRRFPAGSAFWGRFRCYWEEFSQATLWEMLHHVRRHGAYAHEDLLRSGRKLSLAKAPCAAAALLAGMPERLPLIESAVEHLQAANQLANDIAGLVRDAEAGNVTYPISLATDASFDWAEPGRRERVLDAVMMSDAVERTFDMARLFHDEALELMDSLASPHLDEFVAWRKRFLEEGLADYTRLRAAGVLGEVDRVVRPSGRFP